MKLGGGGGAGRQPTLCSNAVGPSFRASDRSGWRRSWPRQAVDAQKRHSGGKAKRRDGTVFSER